ncbi:hypothetical protein phiPLPE_30 [Iodobacter phage PhiPLPE]|uniref:Uncharacterized protein n=1 Tax=Iodobacter phage PhiPLPE TaxID=551895 RepID=B5AX49_9CAUD|nr:hypothetical protein phiPLPE_30 [Iodobacter phage PhiPLPE]ACG60352.1 hypothetical protein phiPLPE_30 [Iodobacter phage PhiPLPE]
MPLTILKNNALCPIIIPFMGDDLEGLVVPTKEISVPDTAMECDFVKNLLSIGELIKLGEVHEDSFSESPVVGEEIEELRARCDELGIEYNIRWQKSKLQAEIDKASE